MRLVARSTAGFCHTPPPRVLYGSPVLASWSFSAWILRFMSRPVASFSAQTPTEFAAVGADEHFAFDDGRSHRLAIAELRIGDIGLPHLVAGLGVERDQLGVERGEIDLVVGDRDAAIVRPAAIGRDRSERLLVVPQLLAALRVERVDLAER